jgi:hypothetical protein
MLIAVSCLSPVSIQIFIPASRRLLMVSGTCGQQGTRSVSHGYTSETWNGGGDNAPWVSR